MNVKPIEKLNLETKEIIKDQYRIYLKSMGIKEEQMHPEQKKQLKETFYGAFGMFLVVLNGIGDLPEQKAINVMQNINIEFQKYLAGSVTNFVLSGLQNQKHGK